MSQNNDETTAPRGDLPSLQLLTSLKNEMIFNTAQVAVTTDPTAPVLNSLTILIQNPSDQPVVAFENAGKLTPEDPLPAINQPWGGPILDRLYIYFPYGTTPGTLTDRDNAKGMTLAPINDILWDVAKPDPAPEIGTYWILFPKNRAVLEPTESISFRLDGLLTFNQIDSLTHMRLQKDVTGYEKETDKSSAITLIDAQPRVLGFASDQEIFDAGTTINLSWSTWNAKTTTLDQTQGLPPNEAAQEERPLASKTYRLQAVSPTNKTNQEFLPVTVNPAAIQSFTADPPQGSRIGEQVALNWETSSSVTMNIEPTVGTVCEDASGCNTGTSKVFPNNRTEYTLTAIGGNNQTSMKTVVFPLPYGWKTQTNEAPWSTRGQPVLLTFADALWFMAGGTESINNPIYKSVDGATWSTVANNPPWSKRRNARGFVLPKDGTDRMWLLGGEDSEDMPLRDIWSTSLENGEGWELETAEADWSARSAFGIVSFQEKLWLFGGLGDNAGLNDVWSSSDGITWTQEKDRASWLPRWSFGTIVFKDELWIFGGQIGPEEYNVSNEIWRSTDGIEWTKAPTPPWGPRSFANVQVFGEELYLFGGAFAPAQAYDDLWVMTIREEDGKEIIEWTQNPTPPLTNSAATATTLYYGGAFLAGGWRASGEVPGTNPSVWLFAPVDLKKVRRNHKENMMTSLYQFDGILDRASLQDQGGLPRTEPLQDSPDVSPQGKDTVENAEEFFTSTYEENVSKPVVASQRNVIYVRGKNLSEEEMPGEAYCYWALEEDLDFPSRWQSNQLLTIGGRGSAPLGEVPCGEIKVTLDPFEWIPPANAAGKTYALVSVIATPEYPNQVPGLGDEINFDRWVSRQGNVGTAKSTVKPKPEPAGSFTTTGQFTLNNEQGMLDFFIKTEGIPNGSVVSFSSSTPDIDGDPIVNKATVNNSPFISGIQAMVNADFTSEVTFTLAMEEGSKAKPGNKVNMYIAKYEDETARTTGNFTILGSYTTTIDVPTEE